MRAYDLRKEVGNGVELCLRRGEVHTRKSWEARKGFFKGRQLNLVLKDEKEFFIWARIKASKKPAFWKIGTKKQKTGWHSEELQSVAGCDHSSDQVPENYKTQCKGGQQGYIMKGLFLHWDFILQIL